jgi:hypothetical protein
MVEKELTSDSKEKVAVDVALKDLVTAQAANYSSAVYQEKSGPKNFERCLVNSAI